MIGAEVYEKWSKKLAALHPQPCCFAFIRDNLEDSKELSIVCVC